MKNRVICFIAASLMLCGCGGSDDSSKPLTSAATTTVGIPSADAESKADAPSEPEQSSTDDSYTKIPAKRNIKLMTFGDSITHGYWMLGGYRKYLCDKLEENGYSENVDFVGSRQGGDCYDQDHEGYSGYMINGGPEPSIGEFMPDRLKTYKPDVLTIMIGTNDILGAYEIEKAPDRLEAMLDEAFPLMPEDGMIFISPIPPVDVVAAGGSEQLAATYDAYINEYNARVRELVKKKQAEGKRIELVEAGTALEKSDMIDGIHPNADGYKKLADVWYNVIVSYITK